MPIPEEVRQRAGLTVEQIREAERRSREEDEVRYVYDIDAKQVRMARDGERGGTLAQAKELKKMAEDSEGTGGESPFILDGGATGCSIPGPGLAALTRRTCRKDMLSISMLTSSSCENVL